MGFLRTAGLVFGSLAIVASLTREQREAFATEIAPKIREVLDELDAETGAPEPPSAPDPEAYVAPEIRQSYDARIARLEDRADYHRDRATMGEANHKDLEHRVNGFVDETLEARKSIGRDLGILEDRLAHIEGFLTRGVYMAPADDNAGTPETFTRYRRAAAPAEPGNG